MTMQSIVCVPSMSDCRYTVAGVLFIRAQRTVLAGEELTISYCSPLDSVQDRRSTLWRTHEFVCACELCVAGDNGEQYAEAAAKADSARTDKARRQHHAAAYTALDTRSLCALAETRMNHALQVAWACEALGQTNEAVNWHRKARDGFKLQYGDSEDLYQQFVTCRANS